MTFASCKLFQTQISLCVAIGDGVPNKQTCNECRGRNMIHHTWHIKNVLIASNAKIPYMVGFGLFPYQVRHCNANDGQWAISHSKAKHVLLLEFTSFRIPPTIVRLDFIENEPNQKTFAHRTSKVDCTAWACHVEAL